MRWPDELQGTGRQAGWLNKLLRACKYHALQNSPDIRVVRGTHGTALEVTAKAGGSGSTLDQYMLKEVLGDYYRCRTWDGTTEGTADIYIARPFTHRRTEFHGRTIAYSSDGDSFSATFNYTSATKRTKTVSGTAETQVIIPYFRLNADLIYAMRCAQPLTVLNAAGTAQTPMVDPTGAAITLMEVHGDGRAWTKLET